MDSQANNKKMYLLPVLIIAIAVHIYLLTLTDFATWTILPTVVPFGSILGHLIRITSGYELSWDYLNKRDKFLWFISLIGLLMPYAFATQQNFSTPARLIAFLIGGFASWLIVHVWGSEAAKAMLWRQKPKKKQSML